jgi:hypothetical protein
MKKSIIKISIVVATFFLLCISPLGTQATNRPMTSTTLSSEANGFHYTIFSKYPASSEIDSCAPPFKPLTNPDDGNITDFHESSDHQVMTIRISSSQPIEIENITFYVSITMNGTQKTTQGNVMGFDIINKTDNFGFFRFYESGPYYEGSFQYLKLGRFVRDNRSLWDTTGLLNYITVIYPGEFTFPPGTWYLVVYAGVFDLPNECIQIHSTIDVNVINPPDDINFSKNEEGKYNGLWYGEFNAPIIYRKAAYKEIMIAGKAEFTANDSFLYCLHGPGETGSWRISWNTPEGVIKCKIKMLKGIWSSPQSPDTVYSCNQHVGGSGKYSLLTSYVETGNAHSFTHQIYLSGLDLKLT